jgi:hypothetical protein
MLPHGVRPERGSIGFRPDRLNAHHLRYNRSSHRRERQEGVPMNRYQRVVLAIAAINLLVVLLFPPFDQYSIATARAPVFAGFSFYFAAPANSAVNAPLLALEAIVVGVNAAVAWLLLQERPHGPARRKIGYQNAVLVFTAANVTLMLLFPPFESVFALTNAALPSFEGFYFIFSRQPNHAIVTTLLYLEIAFVLVNGALFWLIFKPRPAGTLTPEQLRALMQPPGGKNSL